MQNKNVNNKPMLNVYPDSMGENLSDIASLIHSGCLKDLFSSIYILPSVFNTDLDRGFSVIDYNLNNELASKQDLTQINNSGVDLKLDFVLNHISVLSNQFQDIVKNGDNSQYKDFFINWNEFWQGQGEMCKEGYIIPKEEVIKDMFFRKKGLPILMVAYPNGKEVPYWNTFYQLVKYKKIDVQDIMEITDLQYYSAEKLAKHINFEIDNGKEPKDIYFGKYEQQKNKVINFLQSNKRFLGQMDLNIKSSKVWDYYDDVLKTLSQYGAKIIRLDAFAYASKEVGERNFFNEKGTWETLEKVNQIAEKYNLVLLPEIHASYQEKRHEQITDNGYMTYDFFLPGLIIDAFESKSAKLITQWGNEILDKKMKVVNMLGCHDGIPMLDLVGLLPEDRIEKLISLIIERGGKIKNLHGQKNVYYQVNATYYSAIGEDNAKMLLARALQIFMPGKPQVWYLDLFAGTNDYQAVISGGTDSHKEINRTNLKMQEIESRLNLDVVQKQIELLKFRNNFEAFSFNSDITIKGDNNEIEIVWTNNGHKAVLYANLETITFKITAYNSLGETVYSI